jgi:hypothetical protein
VSGDVPVTIVKPSKGWISLKFDELWEYRELLYFLTWRDVKVRYKQTVLGAAWAIIQPFFTMVVFSLFFGKLAKMPSDGMPYPIFAYAALVPWMFFANGLNNSSNSLVGSASLIKKVYFPRLLVPIGNDVLLPNLADRQHHLAAVSLAAGVYNCFGSGAMAVGLECPVSRRALHGAVSNPVLAVRIANRLSEQSPFRALANSVWYQSDGRGG